MLQEISSAIGLVLRIGTHTASEARGHYARLCVQINLEKSLVRLFHISNLDQPVQYESLNSLCFSYGRVDHRIESCSYKLWPLKKNTAPGKEAETTGEGKGVKAGVKKSSKSMSEAQKGCLWGLDVEGMCRTDIFSYSKS